MAWPQLLGFPKHEERKAAMNISELSVTGAAGTRENQEAPCGSLVRAAARPQLLDCLQHR